MNINFTIIIQVINFFIGFLLLKHLLFKPALQYLQSEDKKKNNMTKKISDQQELLSIKIETKNVNWKQCQQYFSKNTPPAGQAELQAIRILEYQEPETPKISQQEIKNISKHVEYALIERLQHVKN